MNWLRIACTLSGIGLGGGFGLLLVMAQVVGDPASGFSGEWDIPLAMCCRSGGGALIGGAIGLLASLLIGAFLPSKRKRS